MANGANGWGDFAPKPLDLRDDEKYHVFLSYRSVNRPWVLNLYDVLRDHGHTVFLDQVVLKGGDPLIRTLEDGLQASRAGILSWSTASEDSDWVRREYETMEAAGDDRDFRFVPVRLDDSELPPFARRRVFLDFTAYRDGPNGGELLRLLHAVVGEALSPEAARFANEQDEAAKRAVAQIKAAIMNGEPAALVGLFDAGGLPWESAAALGSQVAEGLTELGATNEAIQVLETLEVRFPKAIRPKQLRALALARRGEGDDLMKAQGMLGELYALGERDPETLGIYGRTWMDRYSESGDVNHLRQSRDLYVEAFEGAQDDSYTGINAAAKSVFLGTDDDLTKAREYADRVLEIVGAEPHPGDYWKTATVGEVFLMKKDYRRAAEMYGAAVSMARSKIANHKSTWKQACRLMEKLGPTDEERALIRGPFEHLSECDEMLA